MAGKHDEKRPTQDETEQYWKSMWEKEASHNISAQWLVDLRADHRNLLEQDLVNIIMAEIQKSLENKELGGTITWNDEQMNQLGLTQSGQPKVGQSDSSVQRLPRAATAHNSGVQDAGKYDILGYGEP